MKKKCTAVIGMVACFMVLAAGAAWADLISIVPNGTVTDGNLVWLQNAGCIEKQAWWGAADLQSGYCGLTDGSTAGQWRLPTKEELVSRSKNLQGFSNVQSFYYWSSSEVAGSAYYVWVVLMSDGSVEKAHKTSDRCYIWPVRSR